MNASTCIAVDARDSRTFTALVNVMPASRAVTILMNGLTAGKTTWYGEDLHICG